MTRGPYLVVHPDWIPFFLHTFGTKFDFLVLPQHLSTEKEHHRFIEEARKKGVRVILDNGAWETGTVDQDKLFQLASTFKPTYVVAPDVIAGRAEENIRLADDFVARYDALYKDAGFGVMVMIQGQNVPDIRKSWGDQTFGLFIERGVRVFGIPRHLSDNGESRHELVAYLNKPYNLSRSIQVGFHLMGISRNSADDLSAYYSPRVVGIDSAKPLWMEPVRFYRFIDDSATFTDKRPARFFHEGLDNAPLRQLTALTHYLKRFKRQEVQGWW